MPPRARSQWWAFVLAGLVRIRAAGSVPVSPSADSGTAQCSVSCDDVGRCMPLRFLWGAQKGGTTGLWDMLHVHLACGANKRFHYHEKHHEEKESHYLASLREAPSRITFVETYLLAQCKSRCFIDATPDNLMVPFAAARLCSMMSGAEAARARFVVQLREPVSRQVSFLQMDSRLGVSQGSVEEASARYVYEWAEHTRDSPMVEATSAQMPAVRGCNAGDASTRKSAQCANVAAKAASIAAQLVVQCSILPFKKSNNTNFSMGGHDPIIVGKCYPSNYPPTVAWGIYAAQLHWLLTHFSRSQLLLLNMHTALASRSPNEYLQEILDHLQIPATAHLSDGLMHANVATAAQASDMLKCSTHATLSAIYEPYNEILYAMEPEFDRFPPASEVPCQEEE